MTDKAIKIRRAKHDKENPYYMASRATAQDKTLSYESLGVLNYILSKPDDWEIQPTDLEREGCGRNRVYRLLNELIAKCYIERIYNRDDKGRVQSVEYVAHETPHLTKPLPANQEMDIQDVEKQEMENGHITYNRKEQKKEKTISAKADVKPSKDNPLFDAVALGSFGLKKVNGDKQAGARIGKIVSWLKQQEGVTAEHVKNFYFWYDRQTDNAPRPRDAAKFAEWFLKFWQLQSKPKNITNLDPAQDLSIQQPVVPMMIARRKVVNHE